MISATPAGPELTRASSTGSVCHLSALVRSMIWSMRGNCLLTGQLNEEERGRLAALFAR